MRVLLIIGVILLILGIASLFIPFPMKEKHRLQAGPLSVGVETTERQKLDPVISAVLIAGGVVLLFAGGRKRVR